MTEKENNKEFEEIILNIDDEEVIIDLEEDLVITDVSIDQTKVAAQMAYWASVWANAEAEKIKIDAFYRKWRAEYGEALINADSKKAEWKIRQQIESHEKFVKLKEAIAESTKNVLISKGVFESYRIKANALQSKGAMMRAEFESTGMVTKKKESEETNKKKTKEKIDHMRKVFNKDKE